MGDRDTEEGRDLLRERSPLHGAGRIRRPLLIAQEANESRFKRTKANQIVAAMKTNGVPVTNLLDPSEAHGFVRPENNLAFTAAERQATTMQVLDGAELIKGGSCRVPG